MTAGKETHFYWNPILEILPLEKLRELSKSIYPLRKAHGEGDGWFGEVLELNL